jgi:hypothetical protein
VLFLFSAQLFASSLDLEPLIIAVNNAETLPENPPSRQIINKHKKRDKNLQQDCNKRKNLLKKATIEEKNAKKFADKAVKSRAAADMHMKKANNYKRRANGERNDIKREKLEKKMLKLSNRADSVAKKAFKHEINASKQRKLAAQYHVKASTLCTQ